MCLTRLVAALVLLQGVVHSLRIGIRQSPVVHSNNVSGRLVSTLRLPVWPVYGGVAAQVLDWMNMKEYSQKVLSAIGKILFVFIVTHMLTYSLKADVSYPCLLCRLIRSALVNRYPHFYY